MTKKQIDKIMADLDEKIEKATESWKGVDIDAFLDEIRGGEDSQNNP